MGVGDTGHSDLEWSDVGHRSDTTVGNPRTYSGFSGKPKFWTRRFSVFREVLTPSRTRNVPIHDPHPPDTPGEFLSFPTPSALLSDLDETRVAPWPIGAPPWVTGSPDVEPKGGLKDGRIKSPRLRSSLSDYDGG